MSIQVPHGFEWRPRHVFVNKAVSIRGLLGDRQRATLFEFCDVLSMICAEELCTKELPHLENRMHRVLCLLERDFPVSLLVIVFRLLHHLTNVRSAV